MARPVRPPWKSGVVLVCKKCSGNKTLNLRKWLRDRLEQDGHEDEIAVLRMGCVDLCPKGRVTALIQPNPGKPGGGCYVVNPADERDDFYQQVLKLLGKGD